MTPDLVALSVRVYAVLLRAYPEPFRKEYGTEMMQVFRALCQETPAENGGVASLLGHALSDFVKSATREWLAEMRQQVMRGFVAVSCLAILVAYVSSAVHVHNDADTAGLSILLAGSFLCSVAVPRGAWRWAVLITLGIPILRVGWHMVSGTPAEIQDVEMPVLLLAAVGTAYAGALARQLMSRLQAGAPL